MVSNSKTRLLGMWMMGILLMLGVMVSGVATAWAQQPPPLPTLEQLRWNDIQQKLGLTPDQVTTLQGILAANRTTMHTDFQAVRAASQQMRLAWRNANSGEILSAGAAMQVARNKLSSDRLQGQVNILNALGPDLWKKWTALHKHHHRGGGGRGFEGM